MYVYTHTQTHTNPDNFIFNIIQNRFKQLAKTEAKVL